MQIAGNRCSRPAGKRLRLRLDGLRDSMIVVSHYRGHRVDTMIAAIAFAILLLGCSTTRPSLDRYAGGTDAERANALMRCKERTNESFKTRAAVGWGPVVRLQREMTEHTDLCMRAGGFQVKD
jgi:hypothetical protein